MKMTIGKRMLSALLCFAILVGFVPAEVLSVGSGNADYLVISSDRQGNNTALNQLLGKIESKIGKKVLDFVALAGDMAENTDAYKTSDILAEITVQSIHLTSANIGLNYSYHDQGVTDDAGIMHTTSGLWTTLDYCYVYGIVEKDMSDPAAAKDAAAAFTKWVSSLTDQKAIIVVSHLPIHAMRGDNLGAGYWHNALNAAATGDAAGGNIKRNVAFFHGHKDSVEQEEYYYAPGQEMSVESFVSALGVNAQSDTMTVIYDAAAGKNATATGTYATVYYTYATAGYLADNGTATLVEISEDEIVFTKYSTSKAAETLGTVNRRANTVYTIGGEVDAFIDLYVTGRGLTTMNAVFYENADLSELYGGPYYYPYGIGLNSFTPGENVTITLYAYDEDLTDAVVYVFQDLKDGQTASFVKTECTTSYVAATKDDPAYTLIQFTVPAAAEIIFSYGIQEVYVPADYVLAGIAVTSQPNVNKYFVQQNAGDGNLPLNIAGLSVTATYSNGSNIISKKISWNEFDDQKDGYSLSMDMSKLGDQDVLVTYTDNGVTYTTTFPIWIGEERFNTNGVTVELDIPGVTGVKVTNSIGTYAYAVAATLVTNFGVYNITLESVDGAGLDGGTAYVTVPIPAGVTNPAVYYVSDNGRVTEKMKATVNDDNTITFETTHFSTFVVGNDINITVPDPVTGQVNQTIEETKWQAVTSLENGKTYLLKADSGYLATRNTNADTGYQWISTESAAASSNLAQWKVTVNNGQYKFTNLSNQSITFYYGNGNPTDFYAYNQAVNDNNSKQYYNCSFSNGRFRIYYTGGNNNRTNYYLSGTMTTNGQQKFTYTNNQNSGLQFTAYTQVTTTTSVAGTYSIAATNPTVEMLAKAGQKITLGSKLTFKPSNGGASTVEDTSTTATYKIYDADGNAQNGYTGDPANVISNISGNVVTLTGNTGKALVQVTYNTNGGTVTNYITIFAQPPYYTVDLHKQDKDADGNYTLGAEIKAPVALKNKHAGDTYALWAVIKEYSGAYPEGQDIGTVNTATHKLVWSVSNEKIATIDESTGVIIFTGDAYGTILVTASFYDINDNFLGQDTVTISVTDTEYIIPGDGTNDFPEYPNEGSIRFDKTATSVGNFNETGIVQLELSMTGVPFTKDNVMDVVLMLDRSSSMAKSDVPERIPATKEATKVFIENIVKNEDGSFNNNRILVMDFLGGNIDSSEGGGSSHKYESNRYTEDDGDGYQIISSQQELNELFAKIESGFAGQTNLYGTEYAQGLEGCYNALMKSKAAGNQQFCVFMSDGIPNYLKCETTHFKKTSTIVGMFNVTNVGAENAAATRGNNYEYEYYSTLMKNEGITVYTVGLGLDKKNSAWSSASKEACGQVASMLLNDIAGPAYETADKRDTGNAITKKDKYFFSVTDSGAAAQMKDVFGNIATQILEAAKDVVVEDQMGDNFTMIFDVPSDSITGIPNGQDFYMEIGEYVLDANKKRGAFTSYMKLYMGKKDVNGVTTYYAASDNKGTAYASPVFEAKTLGPVGSKYYWTTDASKADTYQDAQGNTHYSVAVPVKTGNTTTTYYFTSKGDGTLNMTSGAYAYGTLTEHQNNGQTAETTSEDLIIATPYFVYNATTKMLVWTLEKIAATELVLRYFLYLDQSSGFFRDEHYEDQIDPGTYDTNKEATLTYENFQGNTVQNTFPVPKVTWNGAQVAYVFYLVNEQGQPVNRAGRVVPFSEAVYVTDPITNYVYWNAMETLTRYESQLLAENLVPDVYELYDSGAAYNIHVYADEEGVKLNNHFKIEAGTGVSKYTTYVFNTKADTDMVSAPGIYIAYNASNNKTFNGKSDGIVDAVVEDGVIKEIKKYTKAPGDGAQVKVNQADYDAGMYNGAFYVAEDSKTGYLYYLDKDGSVYTIVEKTAQALAPNGFNFYDTTVAFAVLWKPELKSDVVVVDFGLPVIIDVTANDNLASEVVGLLNGAPVGIEINSGIFETAKKQNRIDLYVETNNGQMLLIGQASIENQNAVRFTFNRDMAMQFVEPVTFYYESSVTYYDDKGNMQVDYMYSSVTVVPATTIYYEDNFVTVESFTGTDLNGDGVYSDAELTKDNTNQWVTAGNAVSDAVQDCDRPGINNINPSYDANNIYGYDSHYQNMAQYSMGSAQKITVNGNTIGKATFTFWGTGFDVIALTSNRTGAVIVDVYQGTTTTGTPLESFVVDTYYGYARAVVYATYTYTNGKWARSIERVSAAMTLPAEPTAGQKVTGHEYIDGIIYNVTYTYTNGAWVREATVNTEPIVDSIQLPEQPTDKQKVQGLEYNWYIADNDPNAIYQVPVMKVDDLAYGKYTAVITITYADIFDHANAGSYEFYLDAIRIYDPCDDASIELVERPEGTNDPVVIDPYEKDNEGWPMYQELRDNVIGAGSFNLGSAAVNGLVFIDGDPAVGNYQLSDYISYGPNNELYLAPGQAVAFQVTVNANVAAVHLGIKVANGNSVTYKINNTTYTVNTTTDMYYDITEYAKSENGQSLVVVIQNTSGGILSLTNLKVTYKSQPAAVSMLTYVTQETVDYALIMLRGEDPYAIPDIDWPPVAVVDEPSMMETLLENMGNFFANIWYALFGWIFA